MIGREQRSRQHIEPGTLCYLCGQVIELDQDWNRDHVPPARIFASDVRSQFSTNLAWLPTHVACNSSYRRDEEYFIASFVGHVHTPTADAVMKDLAGASAKGHGVGLIKAIINRFGKVVGPGGEVLFSFDKSRADRCVWKIVRGLYYLELNKVLPEETLGEIHLASPQNTAGDLAKITWFPAVRDTAPMGKYGAVFDYKWLCWKDRELRGHVFALLFWDGLVAALLFHDPACHCDTCKEHRREPNVSQGLSPE